MRPIPSGRLAYLLRGTLLTTIASATINFGAGIALARLCGPSALGQFVLLASSAHLAFAILSPGFDQAYIQNPNEPGRWAAAVWLTAVQGVLLLSLPIGLLAALLAVKPEWMPVLDLAGFSYIMLGIACTLAGNLLLAPLAVSLSYGKVNGIRLFATVLSTSFAVGWAYQRPSADFAPLVAREACAGILLLMGAMLRTRLPPWPGPPNFSEIKAMLRFSTNLWALNVLEKCIQRVEYLTLGIVTSASDVGVYFAIRSIFDGIYGVLSLPIQSVLFSHLCRDDRKDRFLKSITSTRAIRTLITTLLGVAVAGLGGFLVHHVGNRVHVGRKPASGAIGGIPLLRQGEWHPSFRHCLIHFVRSWLGLPATLSRLRTTCGSRGVRRYSIAYGSNAQDSPATLAWTAKFLRD